MTRPTYPGAPNGAGWHEVEVEPELEPGRPAPGMFDSVTQLVVTLTLGLALVALLALGVWKLAELLDVV